MTEMTSSEYEQYVTKIVRQFGFCKHAKISNNRRFQGKRQPGEYEIDIAVEVRFSEAIYFLMIIECKYWNRPVDRPVIQALAQTRDAISAHKAVLAAVQGFSKEAISVAEAHGIALWRVDPEFDGERKDLFERIAFHLGPPPPEDKAINELYYELRSQLLSAIDVGQDGCVNKRRDIRLSGKLHVASINTILRDAYVQITSHRDWRHVEALEGLAQWEDSSIKKLTAFELPEIGKIPERLIGDLLKSVASDNREVFRSLIKYRKMPFALDWLVFPDFYHVHLR
jgi:restriction endonuclease